MNFKHRIISKTNKLPGMLGLALVAAATLIPAGNAAADHLDREFYPAASGRVEVVKGIPGGVVTVGAEWGRPREVIVREEPRVVVVREQPQVVVVKEKTCPRQVTIIEAPQNHPCRRDVIVERRIVRDDCRRGDTHRHGHWKHGRHDDRHVIHGNGRGYDDDGRFDRDRVVIVRR